MTSAHRITFLLLFSALSYCQTLPEPPKSKIFDRETVIELGFVAGSLSADAMSTQKFYEFPHAFQEPNPLARPFVKSRAGDAAWFGGAFALDVTGTYLLRKHHHPKIARWINVGLSLYETALAARNYTFVNHSNEECGLHHPVQGCMGGRPQP